MTRLSTNQKPGNQPTGAMTTTELLPSFRPIHYLGSKLRLLEVIRDTVLEVAPVGATLCDLFAGSGTVSAALRQRGPVVAVDIQEYSRVLSSAILRPPEDRELLRSRAVWEVSTNERAAQHRRVFAPLIEHESACIEAARLGEVRPLADLIEHGSVELHRLTGTPRAAARLRAAHKTVARALGQLSVAGRQASTITRYFGGPYFSYSQALSLDTILDVASRSSAAERNWLIATSMSVASEVVNTVGKHFAQPIQLVRKRDGASKVHVLRQCIRDRSIDVATTWKAWTKRYAELPPSPYEHLAIRSDVHEFLHSRNIHSAQVFYADPPYTRDHYSRFYHVLETMCLRDEPKLTTNTAHGLTAPSRAVYRAGRHQSPFSIKSQATEAFERLFTTIGKLQTPLILSYSPFEATDGRPRMVSIDALEQIARRSFACVEIRSAGEHAHNRFNTRDRNRTIRHDAEVLVVCTP